MTPRKCTRHELRPGEFADSERYTEALRESLTCWRCQALAVVALAAWKARSVWRWRVHGERTAGLESIDAEFEPDAYDALVDLHEAAEHFLSCIDGASTLLFGGQVAADEATSATEELRAALAVARRQLVTLERLAKGP